MTVMIVDDEPLVRSSIRFGLNEVSVKTVIVGEAENGEEALKLYEQLLPDVIITDIKMPGMNGLTFIGEIRKSDPVTQFIIISGYAEFEFARHAMRYGVVDYVLKPVKGRDLDEALRNCTARIENVYIDAIPEGKQLVQYIREQYASPITLSVLAKEFNFSPKYISCLIKNEVGVGFSDFLLSLRMKAAIDMLNRTHLDIKTIALSVGYEDQQYFHRVFKKKTGKTPVQYRNDLIEES